MKKVFVVGFTGLFLAWIIPSIAYGQSENSIAKLGTQSLSEKNIPLAKQLILTRDSNFIFRNEISTKAVLSGSIKM
jgi:hypothetical protein